MMHVRCFPEIEEALSVDEQFRVPVDVKGLKPFTDGVEINPEDSIVARFEIVIVEDLL
jgi:hypothetical protein